MLQCFCRNRIDILNPSFHPSSSPPTDLLLILYRKSIFSAVMSDSPLLLSDPMRYWTPSEVLEIEENERCS